MLNSVQLATPLSWAASTTLSFPSLFREFYDTAMKPAKPDQAGLLQEIVVRKA